MEMEMETIAPADPENYANDTNQNWKEKNMDDRLLHALSKLSTMPSSCNAKWWYSTFHNVTATVGAGVLALPNALSKLTWFPEKSTHATVVFGFFGALGDVAFAYAGHMVLLEIQATIPSTPEKPSKKPMWKGTMVAYFVVAFCYFPVAVVGYWAFGNSVEHNILETFRDRRWLSAAANMMVVIHRIGGYQLYAMPAFDLMETVLIKKLEFPEGMTLRLVARTYYVAFTMFMAITFPFFGRILGFIGGFALAPTTYFLPCLI